MGRFKIESAELFSPIDIPLGQVNQEHCVLYAYRSMCREVVVRMHNDALWDPQGEPFRDLRWFQVFAENRRHDVAFSLETLTREKAKFDEMLRRRDFEGIRSVSFYSRQTPSVVFSGIVFPVFDFVGRQLLDMTHPDSVLDVLTFSFVPTHEGWGFLFAWHESSKTCCAFVRSLEEAVGGGADRGDCLFRLIMSGCENMAIGPKWWDSLEEAARLDIIRTISESADTSTPIYSDYLAKGLEGISKWQFDQVIDNSAGWPSHKGKAEE